MLVVFSPIFMAGTKIIFRCNFVVLLILTTGGIHKVRSSWRVMGVLKKRTKTKRGRQGKAYIYVRCQKCLIFQTTNIVLSDKLLGSC